MGIGAGTYLLYKIAQDKLSTNLLAELNITEDAFYDEDDASLFTFMQEHEKQYDKLPSLPVIFNTFSELRSIKLPEEPVEFFVNRFKTKATREAVRVRLQEVGEDLSSGKDTQQLRSKLTELTQFMDKLDADDAANIDYLYDLSGAFQLALDRGVQRRRASGLVSGAPFGFDFLDKVTDGGQKGDLISVSGRPGSGKTNVIINSANAAYDAEMVCMIATFEMPVEQLARRFIERRTNIPSKRLKFGNFTFLAERTIKGQIIELQSKEAKGHRLVIYQGQLLSNITTLKEKLELIKPDVFYVDGAYNMKVGRGNKSKWEHVSEGAEFLKDTALTRKIPVFATYQLNREGKGKKGSGDNIMYSDTIYQLASIAITVLNPEDTKTDSVSSWGGSIRRILKIDKGRDGESAIVEAEFSFGKKPFRITRVISGDLTHIGYGYGTEDYTDTDALSPQDDFAAA